MKLDWNNTTDGVDWRALSELYRVAPLGDKSPAFLEEVFNNSRYKWFVRDGERVVAAGRALADGLDCSYLCDVAVHPDFQARGIGKEIVSRLVKQSEGHRKVILYANPGKEGFYEALGFRRMATAMAIFADQEHATDVGLLLHPDEGLHH